MKKTMMILMVILFATAVFADVVGTVTKTEPIGVDKVRITIEYKDGENFVCSKVHVIVDDAESMEEFKTVTLPAELLKIEEKITKADLILSVEKKRYEAKVIVNPRKDKVFDVPVGYKVLKKVIIEGVK